MAQSHPSTRRTSLALIAVIALCVAVRLAVLLLLPNLFAFDQTGAVHGSAAYDTYAVNLLATGVYGRVVPGIPDAHLPPLYSYVVAGLYALFGRGYLPVALFQISLDVASILLLYTLCRWLFSPPRGEAVGLVAGLCYALYPYLIFQNLTLIDTPLVMTLMYAFLVLVVLLRDDMRPGVPWLTALIAGAVLGLLALGRANALALVPFVFIWFLFRRSLGQTLARLIPVGVAAVLTLAPWAMRNYQIFGEFIPFALNSGENFYQGNSPYTVPYLRAGYDAQWVPIEELNVDDPFGPEANDARMALGMAYLREHPEAIPDLVWTKLLAYWSIDVMPWRNPVEGQVPPLDYQGNVIEGTGDSGDLSLGGVPEGDPVGVYSGSLFDQVGRAVHRLYFGGLLVLGVVGLLLSIKYWRDVSLLWFVLLSMTIVYVIFHPSTRYRAPTDPLLFAFSAYALVAIFGGLRQAAGRSAVENRIKMRGMS